MQASPSDPENFPFVVIGNKIDVDGGNSRVVGISLNHLGLTIAFYFCEMIQVSVMWIKRKCF